MTRWLPTARLEVLKLAVAVPPLIVTFPWPRLVAPSMKATMPVGEPLPLIVAVKVTLWPEGDGLAEDTTKVLVLALATVCVCVPVLVVKFKSPT